MKIIYISAPFIGNGTKEAIKKNIQTAGEYAKVLAQNEIGFFLPHVHSVEITGLDVTSLQRFYYNQDSEFLIRAADALIALPGWETSYGASHEIEIAKALELPMFYPKSPDDLEEVIKWCKQNEGKHEDDLEEEKEIDWKKVIALKSALSRYTFAKAA